MKQRDAPETSGRLVSVMIDICKNKKWGGGVCVCVCVWGGRRKGKDGRGGKQKGNGGEIKRRGREVGGGERERRKGKGKEILMLGAGEYFKWR